MRIRTIEVNGFGVFDSRTFDVDAPLVLFYGENEAGKSTLLHFVRNMLFGFPTRAHAEPRYEPIRGGRYGGALQLLFADGKEARLERYEDQGKAVRLIFPDGTVAGEQVLQQRLGGLTRQVYRHLFAFGLTELEQLQTLQTEDAGKYLFSTGFGTDTARLLAAEKKLEQEMDQLFRPRGRTQTINTLEERLAETFRELQQSYSKQDEYNAIVEEMTALEQAIESMDEQVRKKLSKVDQLQTAIQLKDRWQTRKEIMLELQTLADVEHFPADAMLSWDKLTERIEARQLERESVERKLELLLAKEAQLQIDQTLLNSREALEKLWAGLGVYMENGERLRGLRAEVQHAEHALHQLLEQIDPAWTVQHLTEFPLTFAARNEVSQFREQQSAAERELIRLQDTMSRLKDREQAEQKELQTYIEASDERERMLVSRLAEYSPLSYAAFQTKAMQYVEGIEQYRDAKKQLELNERQKDELADTLRLVTPVRQSRKKRSNGALFLKIGAVVALIGVPALLLFLDQKLAAWIVFALLLGVTATTFLLGGLSASKLKRTREPVVENIQAQLQQKYDALTESLTEQERALREKEEHLAQILQTMLHPNQEAAASLAGSRQSSLEQRAEQLDHWLIVIQQTLDELSRIVVQMDELSEQVDHQMRKVAAAKEEAAQHEKSLRNAQIRLQQVESSWRKWLADQGLSPSLAPETVLDLFRTIEQAKQIYAEIEQKTALCEQLEQEMNAYEARCSAIFEYADVTELPAILRQKREAAAEQAERLLQRKAWEQQVQELQAECAQLTSEIEALQRKQTAVLQSAQAKDEQHFRLKQQAYERRQQLEAEIQQIDMVLAAWDVRGTKEELEQLLETYGLDELQYELETIRAEVDELQSQITERKKQYGACTLKRDQLLGGKEHAQRLQAYEDERESLIQSAEDWAVRALSQALIQKTKEIVEEERQPRMLQKASHYFAKMTAGRFTRIIVPPFEKKLLAIRANGEQLESNELSRGTAEQLYLAMRFALVDEYARHIRLPLVLDDVFVNFDDRRMRQTLTLLQEVSQKNQVLMFTCHRHVREAVGEILQDRHEIVLKRN